MKRIYLYTICLLFLLSGCANHRIVDQVQIIESIGFDREEDKFKVVALYPHFEEKNKVKLNDISTISYSYYDIWPKLNNKSDLPIMRGQLRMMLFGESFAKNGIETVVDSLCRDPEIGNRIFLGIAEKSASEILDKVKATNVPYYLHSLIDQNIKQGNLPYGDLQVYLEKNYSKGRDTYLPFFVIEGNRVKLDGLALLNESKYITNIDMREAFILKTLINNGTNGRYQVHIKQLDGDGEGYVLLRSLDVKTNYKIDEITPIPHVTIGLTMRVEVRDVPPWINMTNNVEIIKIEGILSKHFENAIANLISKLQKYQVDPIGIKEKIQKVSRNTNEDSLIKSYTNMKTTVHAEIKIIETGVGE